MELNALTGVILSQFISCRLNSSGVQLLLCKRTVAGLDDNHYGRELFTLVSDLAIKYVILFITRVGKVKPQVSLYCGGSSSE